MADLEHRAPEIALRGEQCRLLRLFHIAGEEERCVAVADAQDGAGLVARRLLCLRHGDGLDGNAVDGVALPRM